MDERNLTIIGLDYFANLYLSQLQIILPVNFSKLTWDTRTLYLFDRTTNWQVQVPSPSPDRKGKERFGLWAVSKIVFPMQ